METFLATVFLFSGVIAVPAFVVSALCSRAFDRYLRSAHPDVWAKIAPNPAAEPSASAPDARFITQRKYRAIGDAQLNALGDRCFRAGYWAFSAFLALVLSGIAYATLKA